MIIANILVRKLAYMGKWGGSHTSFDNLPKGFPGHLRGDVKKVAEQLIKENILLVKPTSYGREVSLNPASKAEIEEMINSSNM
ncbi:MAG TPA: hypothetical protein VJH88_03255 [Candidatus Nanoarchaeia archaeon]|nr:hypothetical protein [Candidatus Nanoarchaeia archaeon]